MSKKMALSGRIANLEKAITKLYEEDLPVTFKRAQAKDLALEKRIAALEEFLLVNDFKRKIAGKI